MSSTRTTSSHSIPEPFVMSYRREPVGAERLQNLFFDNRKHASRLTIVAALAGSGKTDALYALSTSLDTPPAYLQINSDHRKPGQLLAALLAVMNSNAVPGNGFDADLSALIDSTRNLKPDSAYRRWLVLDDFHILDSSPSIAVIEEFLDRVPSDVSIVLASRTRPQLSLPRFQGVGDIAELNCEDLALTLSEAAEMLGMSLDSIPAICQIRQLHEKLAGWRAGFAFLRASQPLGTIGLRSTADRPWVDYVESEIIGELDSQTILALRSLAMIDELPTGALAAAVTSAGREAVLDRNVADLRRHLVIEPKPAAKGVLRLHRVVRDHVQRSYALPSTSSVIAAIDWCQNEGHELYALRVASVTQQKDVVLDVAQRCWLDLVDSGASDLIDEVLALEQADLGEVGAGLGARSGLAALRRHRVALDGESQADNGRRFPDDEGADSDLLDVSRVLRTGDVANADKIRRMSHVKNSLSPDLASLSLVRALSTLVWAGRLDEACIELDAVLSQIRPVAIAARLSALAHLAIAHYERNNLVAAQELARAGIAEANAGVKHHPEWGLLFTVAGLTGGSETDLRRGYVLASDAGPVPAAYAGCSLLAGITRRNSRLFAQVRSKVDHLMETSQDLGPIVTDRWRIVNLRRRSRFGDGPLAEPLTEREMQQLSYLTSDLSQRSIAVRMNISFNTVKTNNRSIYRKLSVNSRGAAVEKARQIGLLAKT